MLAPNSKGTVKQIVSDHIVIVAGMGEVGRPLLQILGRTYECTGIDLAPYHSARPCSVLHICYPFQIEDFTGATISYIEKYQPQLTIINSTVAPGTTRKIQQLVNQPVAYSPVRGKHARMEQELLHYRKFVAGLEPQATQQAAQHFARAGFQIETFRTPEIAELSKLLETTWLGVLAGWAQEVDRMAAQYAASYEEVNTFIKEVDFLPSHVFPGHIGGHCVMTNIAVLRSIFPSKFLDAVVESNQAKERESQTATRREQNA